MLKLAPALRAGNSVILKPSPLASLTCVTLIKECVNHVVPPGVVNLLTGGPPWGSSEDLNPILETDFVSFTGSERGGKAMLGPLRPCALELGGKSALIVLDDASIADAVELAIKGILPAAGQICSATSRLLIAEKIYDEVLDALIARLQNVDVNVDPLRDECEFGCLISNDAKHRINTEINAAADPIALDRRPNAIGDCKLGPVLFRDVSTTSKIWNDEIFGPVLAARPFTNDDDAVSIANATRYGLANAVIGGSRAPSIALRLRSGVVWINENQLLTPEMPFGGLKASGFGKEGGVRGLDEYILERTLIFG